MREEQAAVPADRFDVDCDIDRAVRIVRKPTEPGFGTTQDFKVGKIDVDLGIGYGLNPRTKRCIQRIAELALTANRSRASCRDAPASIDATTRSRQALSLWESPPIHPDRNMLQSIGSRSSVDPTRLRVSQTRR